MIESRIGTTITAASTTGQRLRPAATGLASGSGDGSDGGSDAVMNEKLRETRSLVQPTVCVEHKPLAESHPPGRTVKAVTPGVGKIEPGWREITGKRKSEAKSQPDRVSGPDGRAAIPGSAILAKCRNPEPGRVEEIVENRITELGPNQKRAVSGKRVGPKTTRAKTQTQVELRPGHGILLPAPRRVKDGHLSRGRFQDDEAGQVHRTGVDYARIGEPGMRRGGKPRKPRRQPKPVYAERVGTTPLSR